MKINIGDWIGATYEKDKIIGYVTQNDPSERICSIKVTKSEMHEMMQYMVLDYKNICAHIYAGISPDDIGSLVDLALDTKDGEWFKELMHEYSLWRPVQEIMK